MHVCRRASGREGKNNKEEKNRRVDAARERVEGKISIQAMTFHNIEVSFVATEREKRGKERGARKAREGGRRWKVEEERRTAHGKW